MRLRTLTAALAVAFLAALPLVAQEQRGSVEGVVKDAQGGAVVGATVTAKHLNGASQTAVTDATGTYRFVTLPPGHYEITAAGRRQLREEKKKWAELTGAVSRVLKHV